MNNALTIDGAAFNPGTDRVYINGEFAGFNWWGWPFPPEGFELLDDGSDEAGDTVAGDGLYSITFRAFGGQSREVEYKFSINGEDNEAGFQENHFRYIRETGSYSLPVDRFGAAVREPEILPSSLGPISISRPLNGVVTVRWENRDAILQHSQSLSPGSWKTVPGSQGAEEINFPVTEIPRNYFRLATP